MHGSKQIDLNRGSPVRIRRCAATVNSHCRGSSPTIYEDHHSRAGVLMSFRNGCYLVAFFMVSNLAGWSTVSASPQCQNQTDPFVGMEDHFYLVSPLDGSDHPQKYDLYLSSDDSTWGQENQAFLQPGCRDDSQLKYLDFNQGKIVMGNQTYTHILDYSDDHVNALGEWGGVLVSCTGEKKTLGSVLTPSVTQAITYNGKTFLTAYQGLDRDGNVAFVVLNEENQDSQVTFRNPQLEAVALAVRSYSNDWSGAKIKGRRVWEVKRDFPSQVDSSLFSYVLALKDNVWFQCDVASAPGGSGSGSGFGAGVGVGIGVGVGAAVLGSGALLYWKWDFIKNRLGRYARIN